MVIADIGDWTAGLGLARAELGSGARVVVRRDGDIRASIATVGGQEFEDVPELLAEIGGDLGRVELGAEVAVLDDALLAAVGRPSRVVGIGLNYPLHAQETGRATASHAAIFAKWASSLTAPYADITLPPESAHVDYEAELVAVIGRRARRVSLEEADHVVFGYTVANDVSVRDYQRHTSQVMAGKAWDRLTPVGPVIVPARAVGGVHPDLRITGTLDGEIVQRDRTSSLQFSVAELVAYISTMTELQPGDLILTGTPAGAGFLRTPSLRLAEGSVFEARIEGIGAVRNRFVADPSVPREPLEERRG